MHVAIAKFSPADRALTCREIENEFERLTAAAQANSAKIASNRTRNQLAGYFGGIFLIPYLATRSNSEEKAALDQIQKRWDLLIDLKRVKGCPAEIQALLGVWPQSPALTVRTRELLADFDANEIAAEEKYRNQSLMILGTISKIGTNGAPYVALNTDSPQVIHCEFWDTERPALARLKKGSELRAICQGVEKVGEMIRVGPCYLTSPSDP
jgi:hypothetical protein